MIDITGGGTPVVTPTQSMSSQRRLSTATLLADGKVVATGGSAVWNQMTGVNTNAEIWDPATGTWTLGAAGALARLYHSTALLLPDATVLVAGGGAPGPLTNLNAEIYYPPYLFRDNGTLAARPSIALAPELLQIGQSFALDVAGAAAHQPRHAGENGLGNARLEHGAALSRAQLQRQRRQLVGAGAGAHDRRAARNVSPVRDR